MSSELKIILLLKTSSDSIFFREKGKENKYETHQRVILFLENKSLIFAFKRGKKRMGFFGEFWGLFNQKTRPEIHMS